MLVLPLAVSLLYRETCGWSFLLTMGLCLTLGFCLTSAARPRTDVIYAREGFAIVALGWLMTSALGALPFVLSGKSPLILTPFLKR